MKTVTGSTYCSIFLLTIITLVESKTYLYQSIPFRTKKKKHDNSEGKAKIQIISAALLSFH